MELVCSSSNFLPSRLLVLVSSPQRVSTMFRGLKLKSHLAQSSQWVNMVHGLHIFRWKWRCFPFSSWKQWTWSAHWIGRQYTVVAEQSWPISNMEVLNHAGIPWWGYCQVKQYSSETHQHLLLASSSPVSSDTLKVEKQVLYTLSALLSLLEWRC